MGFYHQNFFVIERFPIKKLGGGHVFPVLNIIMKEIKDRFNENDLSILNSLANESPS